METLLRIIYVIILLRHDSCLMIDKSMTKMIAKHAA